LTLKISFLEEGRIAIANLFIYLFIYLFIFSNDLLPWDQEQKDKSREECIRIEERSGTGMAKPFRFRRRTAGSETGSTYSLYHKKDNRVRIVTDLFEQDECLAKKVQVQV